MDEDVIDLAAKNLNIVILGVQASGKGTQAELLSKKLAVPHISTGDMFREMATSDSPLGKKLKEFMNSGQLVPDSIVNDILAERFKRPDVVNGFVLDGYPRTIAQADLLEKQKKIGRSILVDIGDEEAVRRITSRRICSQCKASFNTIYIKPKKEGICDKCGGKLVMREDDRPEAARKRLNDYHHLTEPVIKFYENKGVLLRINGEQPIEKVFNDIVEKMR
ncbi:MAG: adenylate kinase [archaeon]